jgi:streptogramin lyase
MGGALWVSEHHSDSVARIELPDGTVTRACLGSPDPGRIAATPTTVWVADIGGVVNRVDPATGTVAERLILPGLGGGPMASDGEELWIGTATHVVRLETVSGTLASVPLPPEAGNREFLGGLAIAVGPEAVYTTDPTGTGLLRIDRPA